MKKILLAITLVLIAFAICGCKHTHDFKMCFDDETHFMQCKCGERDGTAYVHNLQWFNAEELEKASLECTECNWVCDYENKFEKPVTITTDKSNDNTSNPSYQNIMSYSIRTDCGKYDIDEEFEITLTLGLNDPRIKDGSFCVKLAESSYYEIIGEDEYTIPNFRISDYSTNPYVDFKFKVKATAQSGYSFPFEFKIKCNADKSKFKTYEIHENDFTAYFGNLDFEYCDFTDDYFITIAAMSFMVSENDVVLGENDWGFFFDSLNRQYLSGNLSKEDYIAKYFEIRTINSPTISFSESSGGEYSYDTIYYGSKNIRARLYLTDSFDELYDLYKENTSESSEKIALTIVELLYNKGLISLSQYENEVSYINSLPPNQSSHFELISNLYNKRLPFDPSPYDVWYVYDEAGTCYEFNNEPLIQPKFTLL